MEIKFYPPRHWILDNDVVIIRYGDEWRVLVGNNVFTGYIARNMAIAWLQVEEIT
jgi:hypothetical protein